MKPVMQTRTGKGGDCFQACVASVLELQLEDVPDFCNVYSEDEWFLKFCSWLNQYGMTAIMVKNDGKAVLDKILTGTYTLAGGMSAARPKMLHEVVWKDHKMVHDPAPEQMGLVNKPDDLICFIALSPAVANRVSNEPTLSTDTIVELNDLVKNLLDENAQLREQGIQMQRKVYRITYVDAAEETGDDDELSMELRLNIFKRSHAVLRGRIRELQGRHSHLIKRVEKDLKSSDALVMHATTLEAAHRAYRLKVSKLLEALDTMWNPVDEQEDGFPNLCAFKQCRTEVEEG